jgi:hypothetical protein
VARFGRSLRSARFVSEETERKSRCICVCKARIAGGCVTDGWLRQTALYRVGDYGGKQAIVTIESQIPILSARSINKSFNALVPLHRGFDSLNVT